MELTNRDKNQNTKIKKKNGVYAVLLATLFIIGTSTTIVLNTRFETVMIGTLEIGVSSVSGVITAFLFFISLMLTISIRKIGFRLTTILSLCYILLMCKPIIVDHNTDSVPGVAFFLCGFLALCLIHSAISKLWVKEETISQMAYTDALTGVLNRYGLQKYLDKLKEESGDKEAKKYAFIMMDMDNFKYVNDTMGHECGDLLLQEAVFRIKEILKPEDVLCRQGGDEFILVANNDQSREELLNYIEIISTALHDRFTCYGTDLYLTASFGIALYPEHHTDFQELYRYADSSLYRAKREGKDRICFYNPAISQAIQEDAVMVNLLRENLANAAFFLEYQPQFEMNTRKVRGFEALLRMKDRDGHIISPKNFIPLAEKTSVIIDIEKIVLVMAMEEMLALMKENHTEWSLSINISAIHLMNEGFLRDVDRAIEITGFPVRNLEIEVTESVLISSAQKAIEALKGLHERGISISLDDFGTGYASLHYLKKLPIDVLKIDKVFIDDIDQSENGTSFVAAIVSLAHMLHFKVVAEGVELDNQVGRLVEMDCDYLQGFCWGRPVTKDKIIMER